MTSIPSVITGHVTIHRRTVTPKSQHVPLHDQVEFRADEDCTVVFDDGSGIRLPLTKHAPGHVTMASNGDHPFHVEYPTTVAFAQESATVASATGCSTVTESSVMMAAAAAPTGNILVP